MDDQRRRMVIADDNPALLRLLRAVFQSDRRFEVVGDAVNGREALRLVAELEPDLLLLDLCMPELDGLEVLAQLAGEPDPPVTIVLSGYTDAPLRDLVLAAGAVACLEKGLDLGSLVTEVAQFQGSAPRVAQ